MRIEKIFSEKVDDLATLVEEGARANKQNTKRFIEPAQGTLRRAQSKRHHIIFGRRGSGKSSLLFKTAELLSSGGHPISFVDLEPFKGHQYPDIIISVLIATLSKYKIWLKNNHNTTIKKRLWYELWLKKKTIKVNSTDSLIVKIEEALKKLSEQLYLSDHAKLTQKLSEITNKENIQTLKGKVKTGIDTIASAGIENEIADILKSSTEREVNEEYKRSKTDFLLKEVLNYQKIFNELHDLTGKDCYLFIDDLYHILRKDQAHLVDYFHRIAKGNQVWLKIGTIRNRTTWYIHSPQPMGLKIGDDADEINLDLTLEKFAISKDFLKSVLDVYIKDIEAPDLNELIVDGGIDRLVISSGGVARDFLGLFRKSIDEARERLRKNPKHTRGNKIGAEDVNLASGAYGEIKKEEFHRDTLEDENELELVFKKIQAFCLEKTQTNIFLVDQDYSGKNNDYLLELIDLRLIHQVKSRITVRSRPGQVFKALLLDVSQYTGERARRNVDMIDFWKESNREVLRKDKLVFNPDINLDELKAEIEERKLEIRKPANSEGKPTNQGELFS